MIYENVLVKGRWKFKPSWDGFINYELIDSDWSNGNSWYPYLALNCFGGSQANTQFCYRYAEGTGAYDLSYTTKDGLYISAFDYSSVTDIPGFDYNETFDFGDEGQSIFYIDYYGTFLQIFEPVSVYKLVDTTKLDQKFTAIANALRDQKLDHDENHKYSIDAMPEVIRELTDVSRDTITAASMLSGFTAHDSNQNEITGTIPTVSITAPTISVSTNGVITATVDQASSGYITEGSTITASKNIGENVIYRADALADYSVTSDKNLMINKYVRQLTLPSIRTTSTFTIKNNSKGQVRIAYTPNNSSPNRVYTNYQLIYTINENSSHTFTALNDRIVSGTPLIVVAPHPIKCSASTVKELVPTALLFSAPESATTYTIADKD